MKKILFSMFTFFISFGFASEYLFTSESVTEGHPDKICDQISDAVLDEVLKYDAEGRVACETLAAKGTIFVTGEISSSHQVDFDALVRGVLKDIGYTKTGWGICNSECSVITVMNQQSPDIAMGVDDTEDKEQGAGDQGLMFGYACKETKELMPLPISLAHKLAKKLSDVRKNRTLPWLRPDGKAQVTVRYVDEKPVEITSVVIAAQHDPDISLEYIQKSIKEKVILPVCQDYLSDKTQYFINGTGLFIIGGPEGDTGLTGRKIIVDTYGGTSRHGGGCFSGKDPSKVDRSASYMARYVAKNIVAAGLAEKCEIQIAYCIGIAEPVSVYINTFGTNQIPESEIEAIVRKVFPLKPADIISHLNLKSPTYRKTAAYGHFGREEEDFSWEKTDKVEEILQILAQ